MLCGVRKAGWDPASQLQSPTSSPLIVNLDFTSIHLHYSIATWLQRLPKRLQAQKMMTQRPGPGPAPNEYRGIKRSQQACLNCRYATGCSAGLERRGGTPLVNFNPQHHLLLSLTLTSHLFICIIQLQLGYRDFPKDYRHKK